MAIVKLQNVTVSRLNNSGNGLTALESNESGGKTYKTYWKVWFKQPHGLREGDTVSLSGFLGSKVDEWTDKENNVRRTVELSLNNPRLEGEQVIPAAVPAETPAADSWPAPAEFTAETPS